MTTQTATTRLAPSPTGGLHLGNARSFLLNWAIARRSGWRILMRLDDLDADRSSAEAERGLLESLDWLGIDFDGPVLRQSEAGEQYHDALQVLAEKGLVFRCARSRKELREAADALGAPHETGATIRATASMRPTDPEAWTLGGGDLNHRLALEPGAEQVDDRLLGPLSIDPSDAFGDPILWTRRNVAAYHLASVVDDLAHGVTDVIRGEDLLPSAGLHQRMASLLDGSPPRWWHLPLVLDASGRRLAKREGDRTLASFKARGVPPERIIGLLARSSGLQPTLLPMTLSELLDVLDVELLGARAREESARGGHRITEEDIAWLEERTT